MRKNENQLTPAGIYVSRLHMGESSIYATAGEAAFRLFARILEFSRFSDGSKLNRSPQCMSSIFGQRHKDKQYFRKLHHYELTFFTFVGKISGFELKTVVPFHSFSIFLCTFAEK